MINWRWYLFWIKDHITGRHIYKAYKEIEKNYNNGTDSEEGKIRQLLEYAKENTKFYSTVKSNSIKDFPVISKIVINENYEDFKTEKCKEKNLHRMSTSGSTGIPFTIIQDKRKRTRVLAELLFFNKECGYEFGKKQVFFRIWTEKNRKNKLQLFLQNMIAKDVSNLNDINLEKIAEELKEDQTIDNILSYASTLEKLSNYMIKNSYENEKFSVKSIISGSEVLQKETRKNLEKIFKCNIISRYSNQENGVLAQECIEYEEMHLNNTNYYIEFLKLDSDEEAKEGEIARVVITDLYNYAMPMIRYDTGDLAVYSNQSKCGLKGKVITEIYGRKVDLVYDTKGNVMSPHIITNNMWGIKGIKQFKFIQIGRTDYKFILNIDSNDVKNNDEIIEKFKKILGNEAKIELEYVDEIPVLSSGKRKYIENRMKKNEEESINNS